MQAIRRARFLARLVLAWFVLSVGVAVASPLLNPVNYEVVCAGTGHGAMKLVAHHGGEEPLPSPLDCPQCTGAAAPPPQMASGPSSEVPPAYIPGSIPAARVATLIAAPLPARGPPAFPFA